jgi:hypothetical protein
MPQSITSARPLAPYSVRRIKPWKSLTISGRISSSPEHKLRPRAQRLIKYRELDWRAAGLGVLKKIIIGPAADFEKSKRFAEDCLSDSGIDIAIVEISQSQIPYKPA